MRKRLDPYYKGMQPQLAGAIFTSRAARNGDEVAKEIIDEVGSPNNLIRLAQGLPISNTKR